MEINEDYRALLDASAYVLIEEIGDSDSQLLGSQISDAAGEDDAQSCSRSVRSSLGDGKKREGDDDAVGGDLCPADFGEDGGESDSEDGVVDQRRRGEKEPLPPAKRSNGCEGSGVKMMSEREADRLFWEACLASP